MTESKSSTTPSDNDPMIGQYIDERYRIESLLGKGGSAAVYKAFDEKVGRMVAIKLPKNAGAFAEESKESFEREATRYIRLQHPNTLRLFDYGQTKSGQTFIVTELLEGETLTERLDRLKSQGQNGIGAKQTLMLLKDIASALSEAHAVGLVHRDLKPSNIFLQTLGGQEVIKVIDFGIAKDLQEATMTGSSSLWGTPLYMSPEQAHGRSVDARSDLYTLGVIGFECLTGQTPFSGSTPYAILMQHIDSAPPTLREAGLTTPLPQGFEAMINRLMEKDPADRTKSSDALIAEIQIIEELWASLRMTGTSLTMQAVGSPKKPYLIAGMAVSGLAIIGILFMSSNEPTGSTSVAVEDSELSKRRVTTAGMPPKKPVLPPKTTAKPVPAKPTGDREPTAQKNTTIKLETRPSNALVTLDGKSLGHTPLNTVVTGSQRTRKLTLKLPRHQTKTLSLVPGTVLLSEVLRLNPLVNNKTKTKTKKRKSPFKIKAQ
jgi:serine/threonine protein kinase